MTSTTTDDMAFGGSCACSRISYTCFSTPSGCAVCHRVTCRKLGGGSYQPFAMVEAKNVTFRDKTTDTTLTGPPAASKNGINILSLSNSANRYLCAACHTPLGMRYKHDPKTCSVTLGPVDKETIRDEEVRKALRPGQHIFTSQRAWWCEGIGRDGLRSCERFPGSFEEGIKAWERANL